MHILPLGLATFCPITFPPPWAHFSSSLGSNYRAVHDPYFTNNPIFRSVIARANLLVLCARVYGSYVRVRARIFMKFFLVIN